jgi:hypothetical protein
MIPLEYQNLDKFHEERDERRWKSLRRASLVLLMAVSLLKIFYFIPREHKRYVSMEHLQKSFDLYKKGEDFFNHGEYEKAQKCYDESADENKLAEDAMK